MSWGQPLDTRLRHKRPYQPFAPRYTGPRRRAGTRGERVLRGQQEGSSMVRSSRVAAVFIGGVSSTGMGGLRVKEILTAR